MIPADMLLVKFGAKFVMGISCFLWGLATMATALVSGFAYFLSVRILLSAAEGPAYPAAAQVVSVWIPKRERTFASGTFEACSRVGSAFTPPLLVWIIVRRGWQASFVIAGVLALLYSSFVWFAKYHEPDKHPRVSKEELTYIRQDEVEDDSGKVVAADPHPRNHAVHLQKGPPAVSGLVLLLVLLECVHNLVPCLPRAGQRFWSQIHVGIICADAHGKPSPGVYSADGTFLKSLVLSATLYDGDLDVDKDKEYF
jgi:MFS family permease